MVVCALRRPPEPVISPLAKLTPNVELRLSRTRVLSRSISSRALLALLRRQRGHRAGGDVGCGRLRPEGVSRAVRGVGRGVSAPRSAGRSLRRTPPPLPLVSWMRAWKAAARSSASLVAFRAGARRSGQAEDQRRQPDDGRPDRAADEGQRRLERGGPRPRPVWRRQSSLRARRCRRPAPRSPPPSRRLRLPGRRSGRPGRRRACPARRPAPESWRSTPRAPPIGRRRQSSA